MPVLLCVWSVVGVCVSSVCLACCVWSGCVSGVLLALGVGASGVLQAGVEGVCLGFWADVGRHVARN